MYSSPKWLKIISITLLLLSTVIYNIFPVEGEQSAVLLRRTLEVKIMYNSTVLVRLYSIPITYGWRVFRDFLYSENVSYWHSYVIDRVVEMFNLTEYSVLGKTEDDAQSAFVTEVSFRLNESRGYDDWSGIFRFTDSFKSSGEHLYLVTVDSERLVYNCSPRYSVWPRIWYYTRRLEWRNPYLSEAPSKYELCFKIPLEVSSNLPAGLTYKIYLNLKPLTTVSGNASTTIYAEYGDILSVERNVDGRGGVRYGYDGPNFLVDIPGGRSVRFNYTAEYRVVFRSMLEAEAVSVNGFWYSLSYVFWVSGNSSLDTDVRPGVIEGSFTNHVFDGWMDVDGERLGRFFTVNKPLTLTAVWKEELNPVNLTIVVLALAFAFAIPELKKRISIEIVWSAEDREESRRDSAA